MISGLKKPNSKSFFAIITNLLFLSFCESTFRPKAVLAITSMVYRPAHLEKKKHNENAHKIILPKFIQLSYWLFRIVSEEDFCEIYLNASWEWTYFWRLELRGWNTKWNVVETCSTDIAMQRLNILPRPHQIHLSKSYMEWTLSTTKKFWRQNRYFKLLSTICLHFTEK